MKLTITYLYHDLMNIYGDTGNVIALSKRASWRGIDIEVKNISVGQKLTKGLSDIFFFGGGQDEQQVKVSEDLVSTKKGEIIKEEVEKGVPLLAICGGYQLLGEYYQPIQGKNLQGVSLFPAFTIASNRRMIGNILINASSKLMLEKNNCLVGFENHSGKTYLKNKDQALGYVKFGFGNNGEDQTEGCIIKNAIGCYMHGSLLPKNPDLTDWFIKKALSYKYQREITLKKLDNTLEEQAQRQLIKRFEK